MDLLSPVESQLAEHSWPPVHEFNNAFILSLTRHPPALQALEFHEVAALPSNALVTGVPDLDGQGHTLIGCRTIGDAAAMEETTRQATASTDCTATTISKLSQGHKPPCNISLLPWPGAMLRLHIGTATASCSVVLSISTGVVVVTCPAKALPLISRLETVTSATAEIITGARYQLASVCQANPTSVCLVSTPRPGGTFNAATATATSNLFGAI